MAKNKLPYIDEEIPVTIDMSKHGGRKFQLLINAHFCSKGKIPMDEQTAADCRKAQDRLNMNHIHKVVIRVYADGTQEMLGPRHRNRAEVRRKPTRWLTM